MRRVSRWTGLFCLLVLLGGGIPLASAESHPSDVDGMLRKLGRGVANVLTSPAELIRTPELVEHQDGYLAAMTVGILQGAWHTIARIGVGAFEIVTFYAAIPRDFAPIIQPEFVWQQGNWVE